MKRVGLIIPHTDSTLERDLQRNLHGAHGVHTERVWLDRVTVAAEEAMLSDEVPRAAQYLAPIRPDVVVFGCTSAGALRGVDGEAAFRRWLEATLACPVVSAFGSVCRVLRACRGAVWLVTPYTAAVHATMRRSLEAAGLRVRDGGSMGIESDIDVGRLAPDAIARFVGERRLGIEPGDQVFISCTNLRAAECAASLSDDIACPVTSSNLAILQALEPLLDT